LIIPDYQPLSFLPAVAKSANPLGNVGAIKEIKEIFP
jgi:hypothetical protein